MPKLIGKPYYCHLNKPSERAVVGRKTFEPAFGLQLGLDDEQAKVARNFGLKVHSGTEKVPESFVKFNSTATDEQHKEFVPTGRKPVIYDANKKALDRAPVMDPESKVAVIFSIADYGNDFKTPHIRAVQVLEHVLPEGFEEGGGALEVEADIDAELEGDGEISEGDSVDVKAELSDSLDDI